MPRGIIRSYTSQISKRAQTVTQSGAGKLRFVELQSWNLAIIITNESIPRHFVVTIITVANNIRLRGF
jgi:hypothetical protein